MLERMQHRVAGGAPQPALGAGLQYMVEMLDFGEVILRAEPGGDFVHGLLQQRSADAARRAEAAALVREKMHKVARHLEQVAAVVEYHECPGGGPVLEAPP